MGAPNFDANKFKQEILNSNLFSVEIGKKESRSEVQESVKQNPAQKASRGFLGRVWRKGSAVPRNLTSSLMSKYYRTRVSGEGRILLTGNAKTSVSNKAVLQHLKANISSVKSMSDCRDLKVTVTAMRCFGADPRECGAIEGLIATREEDIKQGKGLSREELAKKYGIGVREKIGQAKSGQPGLTKDKASPEVAQAGRKKNAKKALEEHRKASASEPKSQDAFITPEQLEEMQKHQGTQAGEVQAVTPSLPQVKVSHSMHTDIGYSRRTNEDAEFVVDIEIDGKPVGKLAGVLDGHSIPNRDGKLVADFIKSKFPTVFTEELVEAKGNVSVAFEFAFARMQEMLMADDGIKEFGGGSTAVISYIDTSTNIAYTASLGDSEAMVCRKVKVKGEGGSEVEQWKLIPQTPVRDFASEKDRERANGRVFLDTQWHLPLTSEDIKRRTELSKDDQEYIDPKRIRTRSTGNLARSLGNESSVVSQKPKITECQLQPGDKFLLYCDGIPDFLQPEEILAEVSDPPPPGSIQTSDQPRSDATIVNGLIKKAIGNMEKQSLSNEKVGDNVSVIAISIESVDPREVK